MKKHNLKKSITRILACALLVATLGLSLASCTAGDKVKDTAGKAWDTAVDGAKKIYDSAKDKIAMEQVSGMAAIKLLSAEETVTTPTYAGTLTASDFVGNWTNTNGKGALYVQSKECVGTITSVTGATMGDYWSAEAGEEPVVAIDGNNSKLSVLLPAGYTDVATWAAAATDFSVTVTPVMEKTLQAIVYPESATDKSVTWSVSCTDEGVDASDSIRLMSFDGAAENKISVLALQPFGGHEFIIKCTTVIGGFTAECKVTYVGNPSYLGFHEVLADGGYRFVNDQPTLVSGSETRYKLVLDNVFHQIGNDFGTYEIQSVAIVNGTIKADKFYYTVNGEQKIGTDDNHDISGKADDFITATLEGDVLTIKVTRAIESWVGDAVGNASSGNFYRFAGYTDSGKPYFAVTVKDTVSGATNTLRFEIESVVQSVLLSDRTITF